VADFLKPIAVALLLGVAPAAWAQSGDQPADASAPPDDDSTADLLTAAELEQLVGPVALYPDTLLIQILVASTYPMQIVKADRLLDDNAGASAEDMKPLVEAEEYDPSVEVLATAFPDVVSDMADHIEWTETIGDAMLAQDDDVLAAVQVLRNQAINTGALASGENQTVSYVDNSIVVQPADPNVVDVPQYDSQVVYNDNQVGDALLTGAIAFGTYAVMDAIFDDDDYWGGNYWGCRNCGGWGGRPIINNPDVDIDVDGNVNIGNNIGNGNRPDRGPDGGWRPEKDRQDQARDKIADKRRPDGTTKLPVAKGPSRGDDMRASLSNKAGAADISRPGNAGKLPQVERPSTRPASAKKDAIAKAGNRPAAQPGAANRPSVKKPAAKPAAQRPAAKPAVHKPTRNTSAMKQRAPSRQAHAASSRGKASGGGHRGRR
jgi:hypothetical protein